MSRYQTIHSAAVWQAADFADPSSWAYPLSPELVTALAAAVRENLAGGKALDDVTASDLTLPAEGEKLDHLGKVLHKGRGFVRLTGIDRQAFTEQELAMLLWGLGANLGVGVSQSEQGDRIGHVQDRGEQGRYYGIGGPIEVHMDPVDVTGLMCLTAARSGGETPLISSFALHNRLLTEAPDVLPILYRGFYYATGPVLAERTPVTAQRIPMFNTVAGEPDCFFLPAAIRTADGLGRHALTAEEREALALVQAMALRPEMTIDMPINPGEVQFVNNRLLLHARRDYQDDPAARRHLLRLWLMMPQWPERPAHLRMLRQTDRAGGGMAAAH